MPTMRKGNAASIMKSKRSKSGLFKPTIMLKILPATAPAISIIPPIFSLNHAIITPIASIMKNAK